MEFDFGKRLSRLQKKLEEKNASAFLFADGFDANSYYFSGDETHPTMLFVTPQTTSIASLHEKDFEGYFDECVPLSQARKEFSKKIKEAKAICVDDFSSSCGRVLRSCLKHKKRIVAFGEELAKMRLVKDGAEKRKILSACAITKKILEQRDFSGKTENDVAGELEFSARKLGGSLNAFEPMVLAGERSAFFHNSTGERKISRGEPVLIDCGARVGFYCADYTRMFSNGCRGKEFLDALDAVQQAKDECVRKCKVGTSGKALSKLAEEIISEKGFGNYSFRKVGLALGHHVGLNVHDGGRFDEGKFVAGNCVTIEPGIYLPKKFGVRIEDTLVL